MEFEPRFNGRRAPRRTGVVRPTEDKVVDGMVVHLLLGFAAGLSLIGSAVLTILVLMGTVPSGWLWTWVLVPLLTLALILNFGRTARNMMKGF